MRKRTLTNWISRSLGIFILCLLSALDISAYDFEVNGIYYNILSSENKTVEVTYSGSKDGTTSTYSGFVVLFPSVAYDGNTYSVKTIGEYAFYKDDITRVIISNGVTSIGGYAFYGCTGLTSVTIPNSVTSIGENAFNGCSGLTSVTIPNSVTSIENNAFYGCSGLTSVTIPNSVTSIESYAFSGCSGLTSVTIPNSVTSIGENAFNGCSGLTSVTIPNSVTTIGNGAFYGCSGLTSVTIPNSVTSIGYSAFRDCSSLTKAEFASIESLCKMNFGNVYANPLYYAHNLYIDGKEVKDLIIPNSVTSIGALAFYGCSGLTSVTIPNSVTTIGGGAFCGCSGLTSVTIPNSVTTIGGGAFNGCSGLTSVTIPNSVTSTGENAFNGCSIREVNILLKDNQDFEKYLVRTDKKNAFYTNGLYGVTHKIFVGGVEQKDVVISDNIVNIGDYTFCNCSNLTSVTVPNSVTSIGKNAFNGCSGLTSVTIPNGVTSIEYSAFSDCSGLTSVTIPNSVTELGEKAFSGCSGLTSVTIPNSVTELGEKAFHNCSGLTSVVWNAKKCNNFFSSNYPFPATVKSITFGDEVEHIPAYLCCKMTGLTSVTIPNGVTSIGDHPFSDCSRLTYVIWNAKKCKDSVYLPSSVKSIMFGADVEYIPAYLCYYMTSLTSVNIPNSVTSIGRFAFYNCSKLTSVTIPESVTLIGEYAFYNCSGLTSVTIPNSVTTIGVKAFYNCSGLTSVYNKSYVPQEIDSDCFSRYGELHVYKGLRNTYASTDYWKNFKVIDDVIYPKPSILNITKRSIHIEPYAWKEIPNFVTDTPTPFELEISSSNEDIVVADAATKQFAGLQDGVAIVTVKVKDSKVQDSFKVFVGSAVPGDVNKDSKTDLEDAKLVADYYAGKRTDGIDMEYADQNGDGKITMMDANMIVNDIQAVPLTALKLTNASITLIEGEKSTLGIEISPSNATRKDVTWKSSDPYVAIVDSEGVVSALSPGECSITCTANDEYGINATCRLTVNPILVTNITLDSSELSVFPSDTKQLLATVNPANAANREIIWESSNQKVATVSAEGIVTALSVGTAIITATAKDGSGVKATCNVEVTTTAIVSYPDWTSTNAGKQSSTSSQTYEIKAVKDDKVSFDWTVSSESGYDYLIVTINGTEVLKKSGEAAGTYTYTVPSDGTYTFVVKYTKDSSGNSGSDKATIENFKVTTSDPFTGHEYVDLGLSVKWATCNVGASKPEEYGDYFAWGETEGYNSSKKSFSWSTYKWCKGSSSTLTKYCTSFYGTVDKKTVLDKEDDAAYVNWGGSWRMPTKAEQDELRNTSNCTWTWTTMNGVNGYKVRSKKNGNSIFLPAAGNRSSGSLSYDAGSTGYYWSSSLYESSSYNACYLLFYSGRVDWNYYDRCYGRSVRAVCP